MKLILRYIDNQEAKEVDLTGVLNIEIEINEAEHYSISVDEDEPFLDLRSIGRRSQLLVQPRASNSVRIYCDK